MAVCARLSSACASLRLGVENVGIHLSKDLARGYKVTFIGADVYNTPRSLCCDIDLRRLDTPIAACKTLRQACRLQFFPSEIGGNPKYDHDYQQQPLWSAPCAGRFWLLATACCVTTVAREAPWFVKLLGWVVVDVITVLRSARGRNLFLDSRGCRRHGLPNWLWSWSSDICSHRFMSWITLLTLS